MIVIYKNSPQAVESNTSFDIPFSSALYLEIENNPVQLDYIFCEKTFISMPYILLDGSLLYIFVWFIILYELK